MPIPLAAALLDGQGGQLQSLDITLEEDGSTIGLMLPKGTPRPLLSVARGFSAPIRIEREMTQDEQLTLARTETDPFNRWDLLQGLLRTQILGATYASAPDNPALIDAVASAAETAASSDPAFAALLLRLPEVGELFLEHVPANPGNLAKTRKAMKAMLAARLSTFITATLEAPAPRPFKPDAAQAGVRALRSACMDLAAHDGLLATLLPERFSNATSMTEQLAALSALVNAPTGGGAALEAFYTQWKDNPLVMDKWFSVQARAASMEQIKALRAHPDFDLKNPNRVRSLVAVFAVYNHAEFHNHDGNGHAFLAEMVREVDPLNPALAARLLTAFEQWRSLEPESKKNAQATLAALNESQLSQNVKDILVRTIG